MIEVEGEIVEFLGALGEPTSSERFASATALVGPRVEVDYEPANDTEYLLFEHSGTEFVVRDHRLNSVLVHWKADPVGQMGTYPRPGSLLRGLSRDSDRQQIVARFGDPDETGDGWILYHAPAGHLHFSFDPDGELSLVSAVTPVDDREGSLSAD